MPLALLVLQALPQLLQTGFAVSALVNHTNANTTPTTPVETFASQILLALPNLISAGVDVTSLVTDGAARVSTMTTENRGPTDAEKADQTARLTALDSDYDKNAK
jgi:N-acyl-D-aspartate/D-glutamate deacylase